MQIQPRYLFSRQESVILVESGRVAVVRSSEGQASK
jgi:hypothetical protein